MPRKLKNNFRKEQQRSGRKIYPRLSLKLMKKVISCPKHGANVYCSERANVERRNMTMVGKVASNDSFTNRMSGHFEFTDYIDISVCLPLSCILWMYKHIYKVVVLSLDLHTSFIKPQG